MLAIGVAIVIYGVLVALKRFLVARARRKAGEAAAADLEGLPAKGGQTWAEALLGAAMRTAKLFILVVALYGGAYLLALPQSVARGIQSALVVALFIQGALWLTRIVTVALERYMARRAGDSTVESAFTLIRLFARVTVWALALLLILDNLGFNITALVAGLGVGGIAIALAAQNILGDLFASLSIVLDKPFVKGDSIALGDYQGAVEHIGLKTTRLRGLGGEQIICANTDLTGSRIRNYKRMQDRRIRFGFGVTYDATAEQLETIPSIVKEAVTAHGKKVRFDRAHFYNFGASSLDFEVVYYVLSPDYALYMDIQQAINLALYRRFAKEGIEFAFPTQTLHVAGGAAGLLAPPARAPDQATR